MADMEFTRDAARAYFGDMGYRMITKGTIRVLVDMLKKRIEEAKAALPDKISIEGVVSDKVVYSYDDNNLLKECFIEVVKNENFNHREAISFNEDGFIGLAGWADHWNAYPILMAFVEWVDYLKKLEQMKVFKMSDMDWVAAPSEEAAKEFYMESSNISKEDMDEYYEGEQDIHEERMFYPVAGMNEGELDLFAPIHQWAGENCIKVPFSWVIRKNGSIEPYYIASTEY